MTTIVCPACGSADVATATEHQTLLFPFATPALVVKDVNECRICGELGDFANVNDEAVARAETAAVKASIPLMLERLAAEDLTMSYFERALSLPVRTCARWKSGETSAAGVALLRIVATYPWILGVAELGFDPRIARGVVVKKAGEILTSAIACGPLTSVTTSRTEQGAEVNLQFARTVVANPPSLAFAWASGGAISIVSVGFAVAQEH